MEAVWGCITGVVGTIVTLLFGQWNDALTSLVMFMLIDYITGVMAAYMKPGAGLSSKRGLRGIVKKLALATFVVFAHRLDVAIGQNVFCLLVTYSLLGNEGLSILENAAKAGVPVPEKLRQTLKQLSAEKTERKDNVK